MAKISFSVIDDKRLRVLVGTGICTEFNDPIRFHGALERLIQNPKETFFVNVLGNFGSGTIVSVRTAEADKWKVVYLKLAHQDSLTVIELGNIKTVMRELKKCLALNTLGK